MLLKELGVTKKNPKQCYPKEVCSSHFCSAIHQHKCISVDATPELFCQKARWPVNEDKIRNISFFFFFFADMLGCLTKSQLF